jgi:adenine-specific DNA-methyltransferase
MPKKPANKTTAGKTVATIRHGDKRKNLPTAEFQAVMEDAEKKPIRLAYERRNHDLDPQLVWRGKDEQDWSDLVVHAPPLYIQEKVHPKVLIDDLHRQSKQRAQAAVPQVDLFADFNGLPKNARATEFYQHDAKWTNRMILGDSLQVMASLAEREGLRGKVQCIYLDPPYGIKFNSNFQWSTTSRDVKDGNADHITREPEQVKAFRDTWRDGIHSYLTYLRDRLTVARDLLADSGSIFVQIGDENMHLVRAMMDEVFGEDNFVSLITFKKSSSATERYLASTSDYLIWFAKKLDHLKYRPVKNLRALDGEGADAYRLVEYLPGHWRTVSPQELQEAIKAPAKHRILRLQILTSQRQGRDNSPTGAMSFPINFQGGKYTPSGGRGWTTTSNGIDRLIRADRIGRSGASINYKRYLADAPSFPLYNIWDDTQSGSGMEKTYVVQTTTKVVERCILMTTDPGDLVLDPTCGSGTTAYVSEQWGRRWITMDTSRVALALARARIMGARYPYYLLADSREGQRKEAELARTLPSEQPVHGDIRHGFVYERVPHITLKSIANNAEIDVIWEQWQQTLEPQRAQLNKALKQKWEEWEIPRETGKDWAKGAKQSHEQWWEARIARQKEIDASISAKAENEYLYDKPYDDKGKVRVAGPFTVESVSPHRVLAVDADDDVIDGWKVREDKTKSAVAGTLDFATVILDNLRTSGVQQAHKEDRIRFESLVGWPGNYICAEGRYLEGGTEGAPMKRAGILIGPEFGTVTRPDLVATAREAGDAGFDVLIACAFNYDAHSAEFEKLGKVPVLKARMNPDLHMAGDLKNTGTGNLFVIFGEPDIDIEDAGDGQVRVRVNGVDVFKPQTGEVVSDGPDGIACWFIDTDYNEESFFVRHAYFLGANDPYKSLKTTLKAEIDEAAWESLHSDTSRPFPKPASKRIAVKVINHLGDEVMKVFAVE